MCLNVCSIFCTYIVLGTSKVHKDVTDADACECTQGLYRKHRNKVCTENGFYLKNLMQHRGLEPAPVWRLAFRSYALQLNCPGPLNYFESISREAVIEFVSNA